MTQFQPLEVLQMTGLGFSVMPSTISTVRTVSYVATDLL